MPCDNPECESCKRVRWIRESRANQSKEVIKDEDKLFNRIMGVNDEYYDSV